MDGVALQGHVLAEELVEGLAKQGGTVGKGFELAEGMGLAVGEEAEDVAADVPLAVAVEADITLAAVGCGGLAKVFEEHTAAAAVGGAHIVHNVLATTDKVGTAVEIDRGGQLDLRGLDTGLKEGDCGTGAVGNEVDDPLPTELLQCEIDLGGGKPCGLGYEIGRAHV